jgi:hypothetical protein
VCVRVQEEPFYCCTNLGGLSIDQECILDE